MSALIQSPTTPRSLSGEFDRKEKGGKERYNNPPLLGVERPLVDRALLISTSCHGGKHAGTQSYMQILKRKKEIWGK